MEKELFELTEEYKSLTDLHKGIYIKVLDTLADFEQTYELLKEKKVSYIEDLKNSIWINNPNLTDSQCKSAAYASKEYKEFLESYMITHNEYKKFKYKAQAIKNRIEALRSLISLEKEKMHIR